MRPRSPGKHDKTDKADKTGQNDQDGKPLLPEQSKDETGVGWGEAPEPDDDDRLRSERPPHWDQ